MGPAEYYALPPGERAKYYPTSKSTWALKPEYAGAGGMPTPSYGGAPPIVPPPERPLPGTTTMPTTGYGGGGVGMESILGAMTTTQQRAMEDRARAMAEIRLAMQQGIGALQPWQASIQQLQAQPEAIGAPEEARIYEMGRVPIEAGTQAQLRGMQQQYYPGGFARGAMAGAQAAGTGQLGELARRTAMERALRKRQDMLALMGQQAQYGQTAAGIYGQMGQSLADIYGQTIAQVPQFQPQMDQPQYPQYQPQQEGMTIGGWTKGAGKYMPGFGYVTASKMAGRSLPRM